MTRFLASVRDAAEAELAVAGGADIVDLKEPSKGALGAVAPSLVAEAVALVAGRRATSAVTGDLPMRPEVVREAATAMAGAGVDYVKVGLFAGDDPKGCVSALGELAGRVRLVGVFFADAAPDLALLPALARAGFAGAMLDTKAKGNGRLLDHMALPALRDFVARCREHGLIAGLAGSLETPDVPRLLLLAPDLLGFRGALCANGRDGGLDRARVLEVRALIPPEGREAQASTVDYRLLAARGYAPGQPGADVATDTVFVRDFVLPFSIGAYAHERTAPQRVRFDVEVAVARGGRMAEDMRDVFSYDVITDGIRLLAAAGHVPLVETLAERVAEMVLAHPRVMRVQVSLQKLDTGSGAVGVVIERSRAEARAASGEIVALPPDAATPAGR